MGNKKTGFDNIDTIISRARYLIAQMIYSANHRTNVEKGDPKVGGHAAASTSALHILSALHLFVKTGFDHIANKPHASPADHSLNYLLDLFLKDDLSKLTLEECNTAMNGLRAYPENGEYVFQSYHSAYDPDFHNFFPSGTVGIPPVNAGYLALAYRYAKNHGYNAPEAHFWSIIGDSEFREGSLFEAIPDFAERELGNLTWILDYNRQSLDGHRISNREIMNGTDGDRIHRTMVANGWDVIEVQHGKFRKELFKRNSGKDFKKFFELDLEDFELQALLAIQDPKTLKQDLVKKYPQLKIFISNVNDQELFKGFRDFGGHCVQTLIEALLESKKNARKPCMVIIHTIKGFGLDMAASGSNHSAIPIKAEIDALRTSEGISENDLFARFDDTSIEGQFLKKRGGELYTQIKEQRKIKEQNIIDFKEKLSNFGELNDSLDINLKMANFPHTQWMLGQLTSKLSRLANTPLDETQLKKQQRPLSESEKPWKLPAELFVNMSPDVGTSTNLNPSMDGKVFSASHVDDFEKEFGVKNEKIPDLIPGVEESDRFIRFEISEANAMSCVGSFGVLRDTLGIPLIPLMTVYDFFVKRALDQYFYDLYWKSSFILVGTPSGVTLSPEGAQHGWKSDIQIPNQITWEPFYCLELDWILSDAIKRHLSFNNEGRTGVLIRGVTKGLDQKTLLKRLKTHARFKQGESVELSHSDFSINGGTNESEVPSLPDHEILEHLKADVLSGGYYLIDYRGYAGYVPGDNVVNIIAMGSLSEEASKASNELLERGIYANVIVVTSPDLLCGNLGAENDYHHLIQNLKIDASLYISPSQLDQAHELVTVAGRRIPIVSTHDGEPGLLDNIGSIVGVKQEALAVRKHSRCGRPADIYKFHHIDESSIVEACGKVLSETALENIHVNKQTLTSAENHPPLGGHWREFWPEKK